MIRTEIVLSRFMEDDTAKGEVVIHVDHGGIGTTAVHLNDQRIAWFRRTSTIDRERYIMEILDKIIRPYVFGIKEEP